MSVTVTDARVVATAGGTDKHVWTIYLLMAVYALCFQLQVPLEPYLVDHLVGEKGTEATTMYARLQSFYRVVQLMGSVGCGAFLDRYGCRKGLIVSYCACALSFLLLSNAGSMPLLFLSKVPGLFAHPFLCSQTALSQLTPEGPARVAAFGRLVTAYTVGGVIGPLTGGLIASDGNYYLSAKIAVAGSIVGIFIASMLPSKMERSTVEAPLVEENGTGGNTAEAADDTKLKPWKERIGTIFSLVGWLIALKLVITTASGMEHSAQAIVLKDELQLTQKDMGFLMSLQFAIFAIVSGVLLAPLTKLLGGRARPVVMKALPVIAVGYSVQAVLRSKSLGVLDGMSPLSQTYVFISVGMFNAMFGFSLGTSITSENTQIIPKEMKGTLLGLEHGMYAASRIFSPPMGIAVLNNLGSNALYTLVAGIYACVFVLWASFSHLIVPTKAQNTEESNSKPTSSVELRKGVA